MPPSNADTESSKDEVTTLPQTTTVFNQPPLVMDDHDWIQQGYYLSDNCNPQRPDCLNTGIPIPPGKTLVKQGGKYDLVPERSA